jgi:hypothetical protein
MILLCSLWLCLDPYGEWDSNQINFTCILEIKHIIRVIVWSSLNRNGRVFMWMPTPYLMFIAQTCNVLLLKKIIFCHCFPYIDSCTPNCFVFVIFLFDNVPQIQLSPYVVLKRLWHLQNLKIHTNSGFGIMFTMCGFTICMCAQWEKDIFTFFSCICNWFRLKM